MPTPCKEKKKSLRDVELNLLRYVNNYKIAHGYCPSYDQIRGAIGLGVNSVAGVYYLIQKLEKEGYLFKEKNRTRSFDILQKGIVAIDPKAQSNRIEWRLGIPSNEILAAHPTRLWAVKTKEGKLHLMEIPPLEYEEYCDFEDKWMCPIDHDFNKTPWPLVKTE
jgi:SOS-response transcriptional repressor LexA